MCKLYIAKTHDGEYLCDIGYANSQGGGYGVNSYTPDINKAQARPLDAWHSDDNSSTGYIFENYGGRFEVALIEVEVTIQPIKE